ncbi:rhodanese-like domain-containing protein [Ruegeria sp. PrR005]|uniref:Sulfurtransferase n=1 Tax=Ruegeria sp. PrR005 TaxID=2706882 RepID=A0A6B2NTL0_9RHOB|nr:rhodanese-like domain-containing protein [Ruegeria sp. PrR005]NDW47561.1 sulfurtransferase [Ruegeria sp. PrR005]
MFFFKKPSRVGLSVADAVQQAANGGLLLIDVREHGEVQSTGKAKGALHIPLMRLRDMADRRHPDFHPLLTDAGPIAVYCASGGRSAHAESILRGLGFDPVHNIGGLGHWVQAGGALERG